MVVPLLHAPEPSVKGWCRPPAKPSAATAPPRLWRSKGAANGPRVKYRSVVSS
jgi:hypothetical protein